MGKIEKNVIKSRQHHLQTYQPQPTTYLLQILTVNKATLDPIRSTLSVSALHDTNRIFTHSHLICHRETENDACNFSNYSFLIMSHRENQTTKRETDCSGIEFLDARTVHLSKYTFPFSSVCLIKE